MFFSLCASEARTENIPNSHMNTMRTTDQWASTELLVPTENVMEIYWLFHFGTLLKFIRVQHEARRNVEQMSVSILPQATETFAEREPAKDKTRP